MYEIVKSKVNPIKIGVDCHQIIAGTAAKYRAAAVFTAAAPTLFGVSTAVDDAPLTAQEVVILTNTTAALPASGTLIVDLYFSAP